MNLYVGLVHHPIKNKRGDKVTTSVTNLDIHDIARSCRTFGVNRYFIVTPLKAQHGLVEKILGHWREDKATDYNPDRQDALSIATLSNSIDESSQEIEQLENEKPLIVVTGAGFKEFDGNCHDMVSKARELSRPVLLLFGTGWGLHSEVTDRANFLLEPLYSRAKDGYNHLSVRSAVAIYLDRISNELEK